MVSPRGAYTYRLHKTYRLLKVLPKMRMDVLSKVNRDQHIPSTRGERRRGEKEAAWRGLTRE